MLTIDEFARKLPSGACEELWSVIRVLTCVAGQPIGPGTGASFLCKALQEINVAYGTALRIVAAFAVDTGIELVAVVANGPPRKRWSTAQVLNLDGPLYRECAQIVLPASGPPTCSESAAMGELCETLIVGYLCDGGRPSRFEQRLRAAHPAVVPKAASRDDT